MFQCVHCAVIYCSAVGLGADETIVGLESSDGIQFKITRTEAARAQTLFNLIQDAGVTEYVPLPNIDGPTLMRIVRYLQMDPIVLDEMNRKEYFSLIRAANYLDFKDLLDKLIPLLLTEYEWSDEILRDLRDLLVLAIFFLPDKDVMRFKKWIGSRNKIISDMLTEILEWLLPLSVWDDWAISFAAEHGYVDAVRLLLLDGRANPGSNNNYPIRVANSNGHTKVVQMLRKDPRVDPSVLYPNIRSSRRGRR